MRRLLLLLVVLTIGACTSDDGSTDTTGIPDSGDLAETTTTVAESTTTTIAQMGFEEATLEFTACMREEGIDLPDIRFDAQGRPLLGDIIESVDTTTIEFRGALASCASILTSSGAIDLTADPEIQAIIIDQLTEFSQCMRDEGLDTFPDPVPGFTGAGSPFPLEQIPFNDPAFGEATLACQDIIGSLGVAG